MSDIKQVKVDNWGIYFLQRLKHFFNRTDYCDLTLQFQDNAQLKVHRLVLSACTEYFELLERTCEMYEDCLVMPDDLQADVVVPIVNFMYTGHLEFRMDLLERLYQTSQILNMPVLSKLLESHRAVVKPPTQSYSGVKRFPKASETTGKVNKPTTSNKRSYSKAFDNNNVAYRDKKVYQPLKSSTGYRQPSPVPMESSLSNRKSHLGEPRPTRYELPEELDNDNVFDNSFCNISYACKPLMIHPETVKRYSSKRSGIFSEASSSKKIIPGMSTVDIVECKRITKDDNIFDDGIPDHSMNEDLDIFQASYNDTSKDSSQLFDQILDDGPKVTIETKDSKVASNLDHAKIISEVLKKYPHLVKSNKNIKLKILNTPSKGKKPHKPSPTYVEEKQLKVKTEEPDYTYETDVIDSQQAAKLIALGAENTKGPWICLICGTPGKALHFTSYYKFRRHLVDVHNEKPVSNICEYCGLRSLKRNYLLHHLYSQHNVAPPPQYNFPKCNRCNYIALTEGLLVKHKMTHKEAKSFRCNVCSVPFNTTKELLQHIQVTGHKYSAERKTNLQCIYCLKTFLRHGNLYAHLKTHHKKEAKSDGIIDDSDDEKHTEDIPRAKIENRDAKYHHVKYEPSTSYDIYNENMYEEVDVQFQIQERPDGDIQLTPRKQHNVISNQQHTLIQNTPPKQKILNPGFSTPKPAQKPKPVVKKPQPECNTFLEDMNIPSPSVSNNHDEDEIVLIDNIEYIMRNNQLIPRKPKAGSNEYIISDMLDSAQLQAVQPTTSMEYTNVHNANIVQDPQASMVMKKASINPINQPIQIVVSNEEEYKALMSSNHPILFGNSDPNKTLTVLTAQHNATMESATIDLDNAQTNNMMIIQEDFPLNVTEAVSTDNSNIVVVYSHPVDDPNKQFQILTTGGIGSQFVQSSAIITQNYETVTTSAPVMSAHVLEPQADTTWQDNVQTENCEELPVVPQSEISVDPQSEMPVDPQSEMPVDPQMEMPVDPQSEIPVDPQSEIPIDPQSEIPIIPQSEIPVDPPSEILVDPQSEIPVVIPVVDPQSELPVVDTQSVISVVNPQTEMPVVDPQSEMPVDVDSQLEMSADPQSELQNVEKAEIKPLENENNDLSELPDVHLTTELQPVVSQESLAIHENHASELSDVNTESVSEAAEQEITEESRIVPEPSLPQIETDILCESNVESKAEIAVTEPMEISHENIPETIIQVPMETESIVEQTEEVSETVKQIENSAEIMTITENSEVEVNVDLKKTLEDHQSLPESQAYDDIVEINHDTKEVEEPACAKEAVEKIQNLTSEWSEDEYDVAEDYPANVETVSKADEEPILEETIENIQKEVLTHMNSTAPLTATIELMPEVDTEESENSIVENTAPSPQEPQPLPTPEAVVEPVQNDLQTQVKISSLLNDWEDNDSQEENNLDVPATENNEESTDEALETIPKVDNIKSLVSDWDDEDEEIKDQ